MKRSIKIASVLITVLAAVMFAGCGKNDINDYVTVCYENGEIDYYHSGEDIDEKTVFELGSNGKTVAAYTALAMVDEGILELDGKISQYLDKDLMTDDPRMNDITLRELLCHTAGFSPSYELGVDKKIYQDPGTKFTYSGVGYIYLQSVIENAGGMSMDQAASKYVFEPLGMKNSTFESVKTITPYMLLSSAVLYSMLIFVVALIVLTLIAFIIGKITKFKHFSFDKAFICCYILAGIINATFLLFFFVSKVFVFFMICFAVMGIVLVFTHKNRKIFYAAVPVIVAALFIIGFTVPVTIPVTNDLIAKEANCAYTFKSTGEDMALFCNDLLERYKNDTSEISNIFSPSVGIDDKNAWGLGIAIEYTEDSHPMYWHSGINPGFQSLYVLYPEENKYIIVITNSDKGLDYARYTACGFLDLIGEWDIKRN